MPHLTPISPTQTLSQISAARTFTFTSDVYQLMDDAATLNVGESSPPPVSIKRARDEEKWSSQEKGYPKWTRVAKDNVFGELTCFSQMLDVFSSQFSCIPEEATPTVSTSDLTFVENIYEADKLEIFSKITFHMYCASSLFSLSSIGRGDVLAHGNPSKESDTLKRGMWSYIADVLLFRRS